MTIKCAGVPSLKEAARQLGVKASAIDRDFGIVSIDPDQQLYSVRIDAEAIPAPDGAGHDYRGPFSDPKIAPMR